MIIILSLDEDIWKYTQVEIDLVYWSTPDLSYLPTPPLGQDMK